MKWLYQLVKMCTHYLCKENVFLKLLIKNILNGLLKTTIFH